MHDAFETVAKAAQSPSGHFLGGLAFGGITWKFFERIDSVLTDDSKLQLAVWIVSREPVHSKAQSWAAFFTKLFNRVFGERQFSWKCFFRSCTASLIAFGLGAVFISRHWDFILRGRLIRQSPFGDTAHPLLNAIPGALVVGLLIPDFFSVLETRWILGLMRRSQKTSQWFGYLILDALLTFLTASIGGRMAEGYSVHNFDAPWFETSILSPLWLPGLVVESIRYLPSTWINSWTVGKGGFDLGALFTLPGCVSSIWLWVYVGSALILRGSRRFDIGFNWFTRTFDIEKKPLQSIGVVAGALIAIAYWSFALIRRLI